MPGCSAPESLATMPSIEPKSADPPIPCITYSVGFKLTCHVCRHEPCQARTPATQRPVSVFRIIGCNRSRAMKRTGCESNAWPWTAAAGRPQPSEKTPETGPANQRHSAITTLAADCDPGSGNVQFRLRQHTGDERPDDSRGVSSTFANAVANHSPVGRARAGLVAGREAGCAGAALRSKRSRMSRPRRSSCTALSSPNIR